MCNGDSQTQPSSVGTSRPRLMVFSEDNRHAVKRVEQLRSFLPPIRHVNCGLLPTSEPCWLSALQVLCPHQGGYIRVHENIAEGDIHQRSTEVVEIFRNFELGLATGRSRAISCDTVTRVKTYAPGVVHVVLDILVSPRDGLMGNELG
jgi:tRNA wybutosine-synthesizing protein 2